MEVCGFWPLVRLPGAKTLAGIGALSLADFLRCAISGAVIEVRKPPTGGLFFCPTRPIFCAARKVDLTASPC
jgi:hypothetical protein